MKEETIVIGSDHAGPPMKDLLKAELVRRGFTVLDLGTHGEKSVDYPDYGRAVGEAVVAGQAERGIVICGTGIGISIAANRIAGVRCAVCHDATSARLAREHNDANVMALGIRMVGTEVALDCLDAFITTAFSGGERHVRRIEKLG
jgi:ribose 5-phosphate isomerase B